MTQLLPAGVVLDCDGTLADTERLSRRIWTEALAPYGVEPSEEDFTAIIGHAWPASYERFAQRADLGPPQRFRAEVRQVAARVHAAELRLFDDAVALVHQLRAHAVPVAVASSSSREHVLRCLDRGALRPHVAAVVGVDDVVHAKPHPEPYLRAAEGLGVAPGRCVAVEDTRTGLRSARAAGMATVAVVRGLVRREELAAADVVVDHLDLACLPRP